jgi:hypothetical protein
MPRQLRIDRGYTHTTTLSIQRPRPNEPNSSHCSLHWEAAWGAVVASLAQHVNRCLVWSRIGWENMGWEKTFLARQTFSAPRRLSMCPP